ncbi:MAG: ABC transporter permease [Spirochaetaceae bacterium]
METLGGAGDRPVVPLTGALIIAVTFLLPFVVLKENRVAVGEALYPWQIPGPLAAGIILASGLLIVLSLTTRREVVLVRGMTASLALCGVFWLLSSAGQALVGEELPFGRVSPGGGFWLFVAGAIVVLHGTLKESTVPRSIRLSAAALPIAVLVLLLAGGFFEDLAMIKEYANRRDRFAGELVSHIVLACVAVGGAIVIGVPTGTLAWRYRRLTKSLFAVVNGVQVIPSLALFGLMIAPLAYLSRRFPVLRQMGIQGIGEAPAIIALTLYALLPIVRNTYTSLAVVPYAAVDAGRGLGMSRRQLFRLVELPIATPVVLSGIRTSFVQAIGNTAVAALIGAGGLGVFVFQGLGQAAPDLIVMGVVPIILLAVGFDRVFALLIRRLTPKGIRND